VTPIQFVIHGAPYGKKRPRFSRKSGRAFDPKENVSYESTVAAIALRHFPKPLEGPVVVDIQACFQPPKSWSKRKTVEMTGKFHTQKPDWDNIAKAICDGLNRIAWSDDSQIAAAHVSKVWDDQAAVYVTVRSLS
jgi:Holliday junction resolvase RusA-like endonuclease